MSDHKSLQLDLPTPIHQNNKVKGTLRRLERRVLTKPETSRAPNEKTGNLLMFGIMGPSFSEGAFGNRERPRSLSQRVRMSRRSQTPSHHKSDIFSPNNQE